MLYTNYHGDKVSFDYLTKSGRYSLFEIINHIRNLEKKISTIYVPSFICEEVVAALKSFNYNIKYYKLDYNLSPNIEFLRNSLLQNSILIIVNYFGIKANWNAIDLLKDEFDLITIEDNCHSLMKPDNLGSFGDYSFNSLRKILPVLSGSQIINNKSELYEFDETSSKMRFPSLSEVKYFLRSYKSTISKRKEIARAKNNIDPIMNVQPIDFISYRVLSNNFFDIDNITLTRRNNYSYWESYLNKKDFVFFEVESSSIYCPYVFPCIAKSKSIMEKWIDWGIKNKISIINWPKIPFNQHDHYGRDNLNYVLLFPVNHQFNLSI